MFIQCIMQHVRPIVIEGSRFYLELLRPLCRLGSPLEKWTLCIMYSLMKWIVGAKPHIMISDAF
jgi:hypothetical protein